MNKSDEATIHWINSTFISLLGELGDLPSNGYRNFEHCLVDSFCCPASVPFPMMQATRNATEAQAVASGILFIRSQEG
jgi:hypothetical protein